MVEFLTQDSARNQDFLNGDHIVNMCLTPACIYVRGMGMNTNAWLGSRSALCNIRLTQSTACSQGILERESYEPHELSLIMGLGLIS